MYKSLLLFFVALSICAADRPNVIIILADDMGIDSVGAFNPKLGLPTPHLDKMASEGMSFMDAHSSSAVCSPTRYGILTGRYNWRSRLKKGIVKQWEGSLIDPNRLTIGGMLQKQGYDTACIGKWHLGWEWPRTDGKLDFTKPVGGGPLAAGFDYYFGDDVPNWPPFAWIENNKILGEPTGSDHKTPGWKLDAVLPEITRRSADYVRRQAKADNPFFLYFSMTSPHSPIAPSAAFRGKSGVSAYADFLIETDWCVGEILKAVDESGIADNTLVFFTCDNGTSAPHADFPKLEAKGVHLRDSYRGAKSDVFEGGHRVPFIARWPGKIKAGGRSDEPICTTDFMRTVAEVAGCELPDNAAEDSFSLWPILSGKAETIPDRAGIVNHSIKGHFAVRKGSWKLLFTAGSGGWSNPSEAQARAKKFPPIQLYNLADDPKEQRNLQAEHPELVQELTKTLQTIVDNGRSTPGSTQANDGKNWWWQLPWEEPASN